MYQRRVRLNSEKENGELPPQAPEEFCRTMTWRTPLQMIEYLAGLEDAVDYYTMKEA